MRVNVPISDAYANRVWLYTLQDNRWVDVREETVLLWLWIYKLKSLQQLHLYLLFPKMHAERASKGH